MNALLEQFYRGLVEQAGGIYVGIQSGSKHGEVILFQRIAGGNTIATYAKAIRDVHDIELALTADAEKYAQQKFEIGV